VSNLDFRLATGGIVTGRVAAAGGAPLGNVAVQLYAADGAWIKGGASQSNGAYRLPGLPAGSYYARTAVGALPYADEWYDDLPVLGGERPAAAAAIAVTTGAISGPIDFLLNPGGLLTGRVTDEGAAPLSGVRVELYAGDSTAVGERWTGSDGSYLFANLPAGTFYVKAVAAALGYVDEWYPDAPALGQAIPPEAVAVSVSAGQATTNINLALALGGAISGRVTGSGGAPVGGLWVDVYRAGGPLVRSSNTDTAGQYRVAGLAPGSAYAARTADGLFNYADEWYDDVPVFGSAVPDEAQRLAVTAGVDTAGIDFALSRGGWVNGLVSDAAGSPLQGIAVELYRTNGLGGVRAATDALGWYELAQVPPGVYLVRTDAPPWGFVDEWHWDVPAGTGGPPAAAAAVAVAGDAATNVSFILGYRLLSVGTSDGRFALRWQAAAGTTYRVERAERLPAASWPAAPDGSNAVEQSRQTADAQGWLEYRDPQAGVTQAFYRVDIDFE